jgi:hypothetical protein
MMKIQIQKTGIIGENILFENGMRSLQNTSIDLVVSGTQFAHQILDASNAKNHKQ